MSGTTATTASVAWFAGLGVGDAATVGGKGANLGELTRAGLPVPPGFVVTAAAYLDTMERSGLRAHLVEAAAGAAGDDPAALADLAATLGKEIRQAVLPRELADAGRRHPVRGDAGSGGSTSDVAAGACGHGAPR